VILVVGRGHLVHRLESVGSAGIVTIRHVV